MGKDESALAMAMLSKSLRFSVLANSGFRCHYCGRSSVEAVLEVDHVRPRSCGGTDKPDNLVAACYDCNRGKRDFAVLESETVAALRVALDKFGIVYVEAYCRNESCACREQTIKIKDHDRDFTAQLNAKGGRFKCAACRKPLAVHWVRTAHEQEESDRRKARASVNWQRYERDHPGSAMSLAAMCDDSLPS